ncbi:putative membrane protein [Cryptosporangium arvum DSM 44712]|uniref:Putative membrane protein n=1 Tax=Cryptosporangium arvum DSM 44712 TaxID=927661 RepID=A0A010Z1R6_9ACTN|nr:putative membrane protein [Cryptosporangium arvum DSM 44712]
MATLFASPGVRPAQAACGPSDPAACLPSSSVVDCLDPPTPAMPDTGVSRFFLTAPGDTPGDGRLHATSRYDDYGYAGLQFHTYDLGCGPDGAVAPDALVNNSIANMMLGVATFVVGLTNSVREHAYDPQEMWGWTDDLVGSASGALYERLFTALGVVSVVIVGGWLLWSARRGDMSNAATTAGWAVLVMVVTTAIAAWPVRAASVADGALTGSLGAVNSALHPNKDEVCGTTRCVDDRTPQRQASGVVSEVVLYRQWLSGELGSADSQTAKKYGERLYAASAFTWQEAEEVRRDPTRREEIVKRKNQEWKDTAAEIKKSDQDAYEYLTGKQGTDRMGAAFTALISAAVAAPFDLISSILIIIAFLVIRLAVVFLPAIATIGIMRPASGPLRGLFRTVVAAIINCVIFGVGASVYLLALDLITSTASLAGWQQILLIFLTGLVMWLLLRPFRRLTSLAGGNPFHDLVGGLGAVRRRAFGDARTAGIAAAGVFIGNKAAEDDDKRSDARPESWSRDRSFVRVADSPAEAESATTFTRANAGGGRLSDESPVVMAGRSARPENGTTGSYAGAGSYSGTGRTDSDGDQITPAGARPPMRVPAGPARPENGSGLDYRDPSYSVATRGESVPVEAEERFVVYRPDSGYRTVEPDIRPESRPTPRQSADATAGSRPE